MSFIFSFQLSLLSLSFLPDCTLATMDKDNKIMDIVFFPNQAPTSKPVDCLWVSDNERGYLNCKITFFLG